LNPDSLDFQLTATSLYHLCCLIPFPRDIFMNILYVVTISQSCDGLP
jgi:hypothetical protein